MFSELPAELKFVPDPGSPYSVFRDSSAAEINPGALLVGQNLSQTQVHRWSESGSLLFLSLRPRWPDLISLDASIQSIKSLIKARLGNSDSVESRRNYFCLFIAK